jgi:hypothetical protein
VSWQSIFVYDAKFESKGIKSMDVISKIVFPSPGYLATVSLSVIITINDFIPIVKMPITP